jgi:hypothetical protein
VAQQRRTNAAAPKAARGDKRDGDSVTVRVTFRAL